VTRRCRRRVVWGASHRLQSASNLPNHFECVTRGRAGQLGRSQVMALKAPGILVFLLSIILALAVLFTKFFGATIPFLSGETTQFYGMLLAYVILVLGCIMRGL
jgi:hypothetical protein